MTDLEYSEPPLIMLKENSSHYAHQQRKKKRLADTQICIFYFLIGEFSEKSFRLPLVMEAMKEERDVVWFLVVHWAGTGKVHRRMANTD